MSVPPPKFVRGVRVRVCERFPPGHVRTPWYCRGKTGSVERVCGRFRNPEQLAYGDHQAASVPLYRVAFTCRSLWPGDAGNGRDCVEIELYEHWLEPVSERAR